MTLSTYILFKNLLYFLSSKRSGVFFLLFCVVYCRDGEWERQKKNVSNGWKIVFDQKNGVHIVCSLDFEIVFP
jgi:hypothetical protein